MNAGQGSLASASRNRPAPAPGPPFPANSADNGCSVDPVSGRIVFGNDTGALTATLLSNREIPLAGFNIDFTDIGLRNQIFPAGFIAQDLVNNRFASMTSEGQLRLSGDSTLQAFTPRVELFDIAGPANNAYTIDNFTGRLRVINETLPGTPTSLIIDAINTFYQLGDINGVGNGWNLFIDDASDTTQINRGAATLLNLDKNGDTYAIGDIGGAFNGTLLNVNDGIQQIIAAAANGFRIDNDPAFLIHTGTTLTDGAGASLGTLTNAPAAGDPTKWIAIDDNGTTRHIPAW